MDKTYNHQMNHKALLYPTIIAASLVVALVLYVAYLLLWPVKTIEVHKQPLPIVGSNKTVSGGFITYRYDYCKYYDVPLHLRKEFVDGIIFQTDEAPTNLPKGCHIKEVKTTIPESLPSGNYKLRIILEVRINKLRTETFFFSTDTFEVNNPKDEV